jgi:hypothetical protein
MKQAGAVNVTTQPNYLGQGMPDLAVELTFSGSKKIFDVNIHSPVAPSNCDGTKLSLKVALGYASKAKRQKYNSVLMRTEAEFIPITLESLGSYCSRRKPLFYCMQECLAKRSHAMEDFWSNPSEFIHRARIAIGVSLQQGNATIIQTCATYVTLARLLGLQEANKFIAKDTTKRN